MFYVLLYGFYMNMISTSRYGTWYKCTLIERAKR